MLLIISLLSAVTLYVFLILLIQLFTIERRFLNYRLKRYAKPEDDKKRFHIGWKPILTWLSKFFVTRGRAQKLEKKLIRAGILLKGEEFITLNFLTGFVTGLGIFILSRDLFVTLLFSLIGFLIPRLVINMRINKRIKKLENQIGDALTAMANSMRAGFSFLQAMEMVSKEMQDPIAGEFKKTLREISLGTPTPKAMLAMSERIGSEDLDLVITAILIQRQVGGNLAEVLDNISETIRERLRINGEIKTLTAQGRITGIVIGCLPSALGLLIFLINREYIMILFTTTMGLVLVSAGIISQLIGFVLIKKIIQIEV